MDYILDTLYNNNMILKYYEHDSENNKYYLIKNLKDIDYKFISIFPLVCSNNRRYTNNNDRYIDFTNNKIKYLNSLEYETIYEIECDKLIESLPCICLSHILNNYYDNVV